MSEHVGEGREVVRPLYRCPECGNGEHLYGWFNALIEGTISPRGEFDDELAAVEPTTVCESSIACKTHGDCIAWEKLVDGRYCRWEDCAYCTGHGEQWTWRGAQPCRECGTRGGRWAPIGGRKGAHA